MVREARLEEALSKCGGSEPITGEEIAKVSSLKPDFDNLTIRKEKSCQSINSTSIPQISFCIMDMSGIIALIYGFIQISKLPEREHHHDHTIDKCLLRFALFFGFIFLIFTGAIGVFPKEYSGGGPNALHILNSAIGIIFGALQVLFIEALMDKTVSKRQKILHGRQVTWVLSGNYMLFQVVTFLILLNLSMWVHYTFGLQKPLATVLEEHYYSLKPWIIVQRITLPVIIFFRFHSLVLLVELWKNSYRAEDNDEKRFRSIFFGSFLISILLQIHNHSECRWKKDEWVPVLVVKDASSWIKTSGSETHFH